jgi:flagellar hook-associated protein 1 FlgK
MASRSLSAQQEASAVAGQNMANVNNPGYARERAVIQTAPPLDTPAGQEGTGANLVSITEVRDNLLDQQIQSENSATGSYAAQQTALQNAESYMGEQVTNTSTSAAGSTNGLAAKLDNLFNSFSSLTTSAGNPGSVVQSAQEVATQFNQDSSSLQQINSNLNTSIQNDVNASNQDLTDIAALNQQIMVAQGGGGTANDLVDERQQKIEDLAGKLDITTSAQANGSISISIGNVAMVTGGSNVDTLQTYDTGGGQLGVQDSVGAAPLAVTGGSIGGNMTVRDGALADLQTGLDTLASQLITKVNTIYAAGYSSSGATGQNFFTGSTSGNIAVNSALVADPSQFQTSSTAGAGGDTGIALALAQLGTQSNAALGNQSINGNYAQIVSDLGTAINTATDQLNTSQTISTSLANQRSSESGVSIDTEMTNLMQFQKAYEASAQLITTLNQMMETVISMKTV